jgi:hypothetical protein
MVLWHLATDDRMYCNIEGNKKCSMPRYYKDKIFSDQWFPSALEADMKRKRVVFFTRKQMVLDQLEREKSGGPDYWRNKAEADKAAFVRMYSENDRPGKI